MERSSAEFFPALKAQLRMRTKILVVEEEVRTRLLLYRTLTEHGYEVVITTNASEALELAAVLTPQLIIANLSLPDASGLELCRRLRTWTQTPVMLLSDITGSASKVAAFDMGADDYLTIPFDHTELLARVRSHLRRTSRLEQKVAKLETRGLKIDLAQHRVTRNGAEIHLTPTEFAVLRYLVQHAGRVVTHDTLLTELWGSGARNELASLRVHIGKLRKKIEPCPQQPTFILTEPGTGYRFSA